MRQNARPIALLFFALIAAASAQVRGPVMGYLPDNGAVRILYGIPAAGSVSVAHAADRTLSLMEVSPNQTLALGVDADTGALVELAPDVLSTTVIEGAASSADGIVFSPSGTAAALWFAATQHIQIVSGLSATPSVRDLDVSFMGSNPQSFAVSDDGQWVVGAWSTSVNAFGPDGHMAVLPVDGPAEAVGFFHGQDNVAVVTAAQLVTITDIGGAAVPTVIWTKPDDSPPATSAAAAPEVAAGLAASFDNRYLSVAGNLGTLTTFDLTAGTNTGGNCACSPTGLFGMGGSLFRLTDLKDGAVKIFDASTNEVWFVPLVTPAPAIRLGRPVRPVDPAAGELQP